MRILSTKVQIATNNVLLTVTSLSLFSVCFSEHLLYVQHWKLCCHLILATPYEIGIVINLVTLVCLFKFAMETIIFQAVFYLCSHLAYHQAPHVLSSMESVDSFSMWGREVFGKLRLSLRIIGAKWVYLEWVDCQWNTFAKTWILIVCYNLCQLSWEWEMRRLGEWLISLPAELLFCSSF